MHSGYVEAITDLIKKLHNKGVDLKTLPTAIYARKSTKDESQISLDSQIDTCQRCLEGEKRLKVVNIYREDKISGYHSENRKEFQKLLEELRKGKIKVVVYYSVDRETRNELDGINLDNEFQELTALQIYATQYFGNNANDRFVKSIIRRDGQRVVESSSEKQRESFRNVVKEERATGARPPHGYKVVAKHYAINEEEAPAVRMAFDLAIKGMSIPQIALELEKNGYLNREGRRFPSNTIWNILKNEKYKGIYIYDKEGGRKRKFRVAKEDFGEVRKTTGMPQIVSEEVFNKAQQALSKKGKKKPDRTTQTYFLTGVLKCGSCGNLMHGEASVGGSSHKRYSYYKCPRGSGCNTKIRKEYIERATAVVLADAFNKVYSQNISSLTMARKINSSNKNKVATLNKEISRQERTLMNLVKSLAKLTSQEVIDLVNKDIEETQQRINELKTSKTTLENYQCSVSNVSGYQSITADEILENEYLFDSLCSLFISEIIIGKDDVEFVLNDLKQ